MKTLIVFALLVAVVIAIPVHQQEKDTNVKPDNEPVAVQHSSKDPDWHMVPDGEGNMHMIDVNHFEEIEESFNAWGGGVLFFLYTRNNFIGQPIAVNNDAQLRNSAFNRAWPCRFIIHGWNNDGSSPINSDLRNAYLSRGNFNVFVVDWGAGAHTNNYLAARDRIGDVGSITAQLLDFLNLHGMAFAQATCAGHSLGAHACGMAGKRVSRGRIGSIVGLDPANPLFSINNPNTRLHHTDATYVEIIHTDIGRLGFAQPIGHASFYPNWGSGMPGCITDILGTCGHGRAITFYAQSIAVNNRFWATRCSGWPSIVAAECPSTGPQMLMGGEPLNQGANGVFFLATNFFSPFAQGPR